MLGWKTRQVDSAGSVLFRGSMPPRLENFTQLKKAGVSVNPIPGDVNTHWSAELEHPEWGKATVLCLRDYQPVPRVLVKFDPRLSDEDRQAAVMAGSGVSVKMTTSKQNVLRDRKLLLRYLGCFMGDDGLIAVDHRAEKFWVRQALDDELAHDADLDVEALFLTHMVYEEEEEEEDEDEDEDEEEEGERRVYWAHTHGLAELGALDFDIMRPSPLLTGAGYDMFRAIAFLILEGKVGPDTRRFQIIQPKVEVSFVNIEEFNRLGPKKEIELRGGVDDPVHNSNRLVLCDPRDGGLFRWLRRGGVSPSRKLQTLDDERMTTVFTTSATDLMAERARKTFGLFQRFVEEFKELEVKPLVKLGYVIDGGGPEEREHMWFEVHGFEGEKIDGTLINQPFGISRMKAGDRGWHGLEVLTDWVIFTPAGSITPRETAGARFLRSHGDEIRSHLASLKGEESA